MLAAVPSALLALWLTWRVVDRVLGVGAVVSKASILVLKMSQGFQPGEGPRSDLYPGGIHIVKGDKDIGGVLYEIKGLEEFRGRYFEVTLAEARIIAAFIEAWMATPTEGRLEALRFFLENFPADRVS